VAGPPDGELEPVKRTIPTLILLAVLAAACSTPAASTVPSSTATPSAAPSAAPSASVLSVQEQITATTKGIDDALVAYKTGDATNAYQLAGDAYLEHFEFVEPALDPLDKPLREQIEKLIRDDLRAAIQAGKPTPEVEAIAIAAKTALQTAASKLK
jgi:hypothetical protein